MCYRPQVWRPSAYRLAGGHNQSALNAASYDLKCEATREMFVDEELMAQADYLVRSMTGPLEEACVTGRQQTLDAVQRNNVQWSHVYHMEMVGKQMWAVNHICTMQCITPLHHMRSSLELRPSWTLAGFRQTEPTKCRSDADSCRALRYSSKCQICLQYLALLHGLPNAPRAGGLIQLGHPAVHHRAAPQEVRQEPHHLCGLQRAPD